MFASVARSSVSKRPIWLVEAACPSTALPPTIQRMAGLWAGQKMGDVFLENVVLRQADCVQEALGFKVIINLRRSERGVAAKIKPDLAVLIAVHHRLQNITPTIGTVNVPRP